MVHAHSEPKYSIATSDYRCLECSDEVACEATYYSAVIFGDGEFQRRNYCSNCWKRRTAGRPGEAAGTAPTGDVFASWRTRRPAAPADRPSKMRFDAGLTFEFFLRLGPESEPPADAAADSDPGSQAVAGAEPDGARADHGPRGAEDSEERDSTAAGHRGSSGARAGEAHGPERSQLRFFLALLLIRKKALKFKSSVDRHGEEWLLLLDRETPPRVHEVLNPGLTESQLERLKDKLGELLQMQI